MQITFLEQELEDFLCRDNNLQKYLNLKFIARQVEIKPIGVVDILAYDKANKCFIIIELKKDSLDKSALCQGLSYLNFYKKTRSVVSNRIIKIRNFKLLLVGQNLSEDLQKCVTHYTDEFSSDDEIFYTLFSIKFDAGVSFDYYNTFQKEIEDQLYEQAEMLDVLRYRTH